MVLLILGQDVANKRERKYTAAHIVAKSQPLYQAAGMRRYRSLIIINPSVFPYRDNEIFSRNVSVPHNTFTYWKQNFYCMYLFEEVWTRQSHHDPLGQSHSKDNFLIEYETLCLVFENGEELRTNVQTCLKGVGSAKWISNQ